MHTCVRAHTHIRVCALTISHPSLFSRRSTCFRRLTGDNTPKRVHIQTHALPYGTLSLSLSHTHTHTLVQTLYIFEEADDHPKEVRVRDIFGGKKAVLFGLPGVWPSTAYRVHCTVLASCTIAQTKPSPTRVGPDVVLPVA